METVESFFYDSQSYPSRCIRIYRDVYKRQVVVLLLLPTMMFAIPESGKKVTLNLESVTVKDFFDALRPVSYTHLDVYKRQLLRHGKRRRWRQAVQTI